VSGGVLEEVEERCVCFFLTGDRLPLLAKQVEEGGEGGREEE